ncbi:hypothetical protein OIDMADRAFT_174960 [Oidiodendron maius Zn]|uniref:Uncharacterized protein n=1 Tax=Oidiodendron maius (strain Zn) TaxID=913774 RepID=A0A0C3D9U0_OIDMZ|nr:hypothetical protein OIDMADRAFT_174960 [Oidiodendron maius Zn]
MPHDNQSRENPARDKDRTGGACGYQQIFTEGPGRRYPTSYTTLLLRFPVDNNTATNMFGGPPPQPTAEELAAQNAEATLTVQKIIVGSILLYLSPFAIDVVRKLV